MNFVSHLFIHPFLLSSIEMLWDVFSRFDRVNHRCIFILLPNVPCAVLFSYELCSKINFIILTDIFVGARSVYLFVSTSVVCIFWRWSAVGRWVPRYGRCLDNAIDGDRILKAVFFNSNRVGVKVDDTKRSCAARWKIEVCAGGDLVCVLIVSCDMWWSSKEYIFSGVLTCNFAYTPVESLTVTLVQLSQMIVYFRLQSAGAGF